MNPITCNSSLLLPVERRERVGKLISSTHWLMFSFITRGQSLCKRVSLSHTLALRQFSLSLSPSRLSSFLSPIQTPPHIHTRRHAHYINPNRRSSLSLLLMNPLKAGARALWNTHSMHTHTHTCSHTFTCARAHTLTHTDTHTHTNNSAFKFPHPAVLFINKQLLSVPPH